MNNNSTNIKLPNTEIGQQIQQRFSDETTLQALDNIIGRIGTLEKAVVKLTTLLEQGPGLLSMTMDMVDEGVKQSADKGIYVEERIGSALALAEKLTAPAMVEKLNGVLVLSEQAPGLLSMTMDMVDEGVKQSADKGIYIEERIGTALALAEKLTAPAMVEKLNGVLVLSEQAPGLLSMTMDMVDEGVKKAADRGVYIEQRIGMALELAEKLTTPDMSEKMNSLLNFANQASGLMAMTVDMVDDQYRKANESEVDLAAIVELAQNTGKAISNTAKTPNTSIGLFGLIKALKDPDRQKALGFVMELTKQLGKAL